jgi:hypothetical protein
LSSKAKIKGTRVEREIVKLFEAQGFSARRQPMSGALMDFPHDVYVNDLFDGTTIEVKARKNGAGFKQLDDWKGSADILVLKKDFENPSVYLDWKLFKEFLDVYRQYQHRFGSESGNKEAVPTKLSREATIKKDRKKSSPKIPSRKFSNGQGSGQNDRISWSTSKRKIANRVYRKSEVDGTVQLQTRWQYLKELSKNR